MSTHTSTLMPTKNLGRQIRPPATHTTSRSANKPLGKRNLTEKANQIGKRKGQKIATKKMQVARIQRSRQLQLTRQSHNVDTMRKVSRDARGQLRGGGLLIDRIA